MTAGTIKVSAGVSFKFLVVGAKITRLIVLDYSTV